MSKRIKILARYQGNREDWCICEDTPSGGIVADLVNMGYVQKYQSGAVYPVLCVGFSWLVEDTPQVTGIMEDLYPHLKAMGCNFRDQWQDRERLNQVWAYRNPYGNDDIIQKVEAALARAGYNKSEKWRMVEWTKE